MSVKNNQLSCRLAIIVAVTVFAAMLTMPGCKKKPAANESTEKTLTENSRNKAAPSAPAAESPKPKTDTTADRKTSPKTTLKDIIRSARNWGPVYDSSFGQTAPDFTITDVTGKKHSLSDYRGKNVMIIFWATWCGPCKKELPHLIALRNRISEDKLAMLAISYKSAYPPETTEKVKDFVKQNKINYTVFSVDADAMPSPFNSVSGIPCSFFIDPQGKIKLATIGPLSLGEIKAILEAER